jgi:hypothetical protein
LVDKLLQPTRSYDITLSINNNQDTLYSKFLEEIRIETSLVSAWTAVTLEIFIPPHVIIKDKLYGQDTITLKLDLLGQDETIKENTELDLLMISSEFEVPVTTEMATGSQEDRTIMRIQTVTRIPFITMTTMVNKVYGVHMSPMTPKQIIDDMISTYAPNVEETEWGTGDSIDIIKQVCIPPTTLYDAINYIDSTFGIFEGVSGIFCRYDNTIFIRNLAEEILKQPSMIIEHMTTSDNPVLKEEDKSKVLTYDNIHTSYTGNAKFSYYGKTLKHIVLPDDKLSETIELDLETISQENGCSDGSEIPIHKDLERIRYYIAHGGFGESEVFAKSMMAKSIYDMTRSRINIEKNILIEPLLNVGASILLGIKTLEHKPIGKKYILLSTDIKLHRTEAGWEATAALELVKTNRTV